MILVATCILLVRWGPCFASLVRNDIVLPRRLAVLNFGTVIIRYMKPSTLQLVASDSLDLWYLHLVAVKVRKTIFKKSALKLWSVSQL